MRSSQSQDHSLAAVSRLISKHPQDPKYKDAIDSVTSTGSFNILISLLRASCLDDVLRERSSFTLLAPTDEAFAKLPTGKIENLLQERHPDRLVSLLSCHIISTLISSSSLATSSIDAKTIGQEAVAITIQGKWISIHSATGDQMVNASVVGNDIKLSNRVVIPINAIVMSQNTTAIVSIDGCASCVET